LGATAAVIVAASADITEDDDTAAETSGATQSEVSSLSGGYLNLVRSKPKRTAKPKPLDKRTVRLAVIEQDDGVSAGAALAVASELYLISADDAVVSAAFVEITALHAASEADDAVTSIASTDIAARGELTEHDDAASAATEITPSKWVSYDNDFLLAA
jgi:hypothetical protein